MSRTLHVSDRNQRIPVRKLSASMEASAAPTPALSRSNQAEGRCSGRGSRGPLESLPCAALSWENGCAQQRTIFGETMWRVAFLESTTSLASATIRSIS